MQPRLPNAPVPGNIRLTGRVTAAGVLILTAFARSQSLDPDTTNNTVTIRVEGPAAAATPPPVARPSTPAGVTRTGTKGADTLRGGAGNDRIRVLGGPDRL